MCEPDFGSRRAGPAAREAPSPASPAPVHAALPTKNAGGTAAAGSFAPGISTEALVLRAGYGDVEAAFAAAHGIVTLDLTIGRHSAVPMETRGALARFDGAVDVLVSGAR
jgi:CO/xanthine dehydrogenase Mo-binding subunit